VGENRLKVNVVDLMPGMYVSELDRPWLGTPFLLQGFEIRDDEQIAELQKTCRYVFVDTERTSADVRQHLLSLPETRHARARRQRQFTDTVTLKPDLVEQVDFYKELKAAKTLHAESYAYTVQALEDVRLGRSVDTRQARRLVLRLTDSIVRNDHALVWLTQLKARDEYTVTHCINVCILALSFGRYLGLPQHELHALGLGALLHDLGKMKVPLDVLNKPGRLTPAEFEIIKQHPVQGYQLLTRNAGLSEPVLDIVRHHHERLDGKGYPDQLPDSQIRELTRIASIVDVYDAITSDRVYHDGIPPHDALRNMFDWAPGNFDQALIEAFIRCLGIYPIGSLVELKSGHVGVVVTSNEANRLKPSVLLILNRDKQPYPKRKFINLASPRWQTGKQPPEIARVLEQDAYGIDLPAIVEAECLQA